MAVPSPSIRPELVPGGVHRAIYMGMVGVSSTPTEGDYATGVVRLRRAAGSPLDPPPIGRIFIGPGDKRFTSTAMELSGSDVLYAVRAVETGSDYNIAQGTALQLQFEPGDHNAYFEPNATVENDFSGGVSAQAAQTQLHLDLTAFSPYVRGNPYFADQLEIWIQPLDAGITQVLPQVVRREDMVGSPPEYLTLTVENDADANQWVIWVHALHSHHR